MTIECRRGWSELRPRQRVQMDSVYLPDIERIMKDPSTTAQIAFETQYPLRSGFVADFAILREKVIPESDGEDCHNTPKAKRWNVRKRRQRSTLTLSLTLSAAPLSYEALHRETAILDLLDLFFFDIHLAALSYKGRQKRTG